MIVETVKGNLITLAKEGNFDAIVQGCNCFNTMGRGIALTIKEEFPSAYEADCATIKGDPFKLGDYTVSRIKGIKDRKKYSFLIINGYTQYDFRGANNIEYSAVYKVFETLNKDLNNTHSRFEYPKFGIPKIGAGLAGGNWETIKMIINEATPNIDIIVVDFDGSKV